MKYMETELLELIADQAKKILALERDKKEAAQTAETWRSLWRDKSRDLETLRAKLEGFINEHS